MKHYLILIFSTFLISTSVLAQSPPQSFTYQTVIRDNAYNIMANQDITLRISIIEDSPNGTIVYQEKAPVTTSPIGLVNLNIGEGNNPSGDFESIDWANHIFFLEIAADFDSNNNFVVFGTTQLRSVPYALYALNAGNANQGLQGPPGQDGVDGEQGPQGPIGETGPQGEQGIQGPTGETGPQGEQGIQGPIGEPGPQGEQGIPGINGLNGDDGIGIINTIDNQDGTFTLIYSDGSLFTTSNFTGQQGIQGPIGETGPQGEQGIQGPIGNTIWQQDDLNNILYSSGNVNIGANNNSSAILNISSTTQGILIPSLNENERDNISNPATGLLIFQNDVEPGFYFYDGTNWKSINSNSSSSFDPTIIYTIDGF